MASKVIPNPAFALQYARSQDCAKLLGAVGGVVAGRAQQIARGEAYDTGEYERGIVANVGIEGPTYRARIAGTAPYSGYLEVGTEDTAAHHTLARAAESIGLRILAEGSE